MNNISKFLRIKTEEVISGETINEQLLWDKVEKLVEIYRGNCELKYDDGYYHCKLYLHKTKIGSWFPESKDKDRLFAMIKCLKLVDDVLGNDHEL